MQRQSGTESLALSTSAVLVAHAQMYSNHSGVSKMSVRGHKVWSIKESRNSRVHTGQITVHYCRPSTEHTSGAGHTPPHHYSTSMTWQLTACG